MTPAAPPPSSRLLRAAEAERSELDGHRERLLARREDLRAELSRIDAGLAEVDERRRLLDRLAPTELDPPMDIAPERETPDAGVADRSGQLRHESDALVDRRAVLRGPAIRETAVRLLLARSEHVEALHYRDWFDMVIADGYVIAGKDPLAVFLTQVSRSPVVRRSTQAGIYEIDDQTPGRLRRQLDELHEQLRDLSAAPTAAADLSETRARRQELMTEIGHVEKALEEASRLLDAEPAAALAATG